MKRKYWGILPVMLLSALSVQADETEYMVFQSKAGEQEIALSELKKVVFQDGKLVAEKKDNTSVRFTLSDLSKLFFRMQTTGISRPEAAAGRMMWYPQTAELLLPETVSGEWATVYSLSGTVVCRERMAAAGGSLSLERLPKGIYMVRYAGTTLKIVKP